jgi:hypothetical protein
MLLEMHEIHKLHHTENDIYNELWLSVTIMAANIFASQFRLLKLAPPST